MIINRLLWWNDIGDVIYMIVMGKILFYVFKLGAIYIIVKYIYVFCVLVLS